MMGLCVKEQGQSVHAIQLLEKLIADSRCRGGNAQLVRYELGLLYEKMGVARSCDRHVPIIPSFDDVPRRLESLRNHSNGVAASRVLRFEAADSRAACRPLARC